MRRSSSASKTKGSSRGLFDSVLARGEVWEATTDEAWLQAMVDAEACLALACARSFLIPHPSGEAIFERCDQGGFDLGRIGHEAAIGGNPVIPLVDALRHAVGPEHAAHVHFGATSQDILDTASMAMVRDALHVMFADLDELGGRLAELARRHRTTPMIGRTLLQQAVPITFGAKVASWLAGIDVAGRRLREVLDTRLAVQLGGAAGTLAPFGEEAFEVLKEFASGMHLAVPVAPWHTERSRIGDLAGALGVLAGAIGTIATDIVLLAQNEVGEVTEEGGAGHGGSSAMAHKTNPIDAISARAAAMQAPGLVSTLLTAMVQEHERAAGAWHAEWRPLRELLRSVGSAASWLVASLGILHVDTDRMAANLRGAIGEGEIDVGSAPEFVDRILADYARFHDDVWDDE